ncbi:hypothetical protein L0M19_04390, partial [Streptomyces indiaensis]|nr:hypothetical protein [Streptomyces indiaensis]
MRVVIVTESFPPDVNGVAHCALQTARYLVARGHAPVVVAPAPAPGCPRTPRPPTTHACSSAPHQLLTRPPGRKPRPR